VRVLLAPKRVVSGFAGRRSWRRAHRARFVGVTYILVNTHCSACESRVISYLEAMRLEC